ncbi:MAG: hypothetical protein ACTSSE_07070 [Candidatus Thorarchaeota archaeon]
MNAPIMFNRRLSKSELDIWIDLLRNKTDFGYMTRELATSFLSHQDTMCFVSSVQKKIVGGTVIFRDRIRLGMVLASVAVNNEFREQVAYSVIKSSLPFFKTVAIRDVDALIPDDPSERRFGFPISLELDPWTKDVLRRIGFEEKNTLYAYTLTIKEGKETNQSKSKWDSKLDLDKTKKLIWDSNKATGLVNSHIWTALEFARNQRTLRTLSVEDSLKLVFSFSVSGTKLIINFLVSDEDFIELGVASRLIVQTIRESKVDSVRFPLVGKGQTELIRAISDELGGFLKRRSMTLMRKPL